MKFYRTKHGFRDAIPKFFDNIASYQPKLEPNSKFSRDRRVDKIQLLEDKIDQCFKECNV